MKRQYKDNRFASHDWNGTAETVVLNSVHNKVSGWDSHRESRSTEEKIEELCRIMAEIAERTNIDLTEFIDGYTKVTPQD